MRFLSNVIAQRQKGGGGSAESSECNTATLTCPLHFVLAATDTNSPTVKKLQLRAVVLAASPRKLLCAGRKHLQIILDFVNASLPQCAQTSMKELCFPHRPSPTPHITENRFPEALLQLRRLTRLNVCPNYTITYNVETGSECCTDDVSIQQSINQSSHQSISQSVSHFSFVCSVKLHLRMSQAVCTIREQKNQLSQN